MKNLAEIFGYEINTLQAALKKPALSELSPLHRLREEMHLIRQAQQRVHEYVHAHPFADDSEEISYHKELYPKLRALHIFRVEIYLIEKDLPPTGAEYKRAYYGQQLEMILAYIRKYQFLYTYFKLKADDLDALYFTAAGNGQSVLLPVLEDPDISHTTETGYLFARFMAYELLFRYIVGKLENAKKPFRWTGETVNLIELLHGIYLNGQVNNGEVGIVEFFNGMGEFFGVDLGVPKKGLEALMKRKKLSKTHFTDRMQEKLTERMDQELDLEREKRRRSRAGF